MQVSLAAARVNAKLTQTEVSEKIGVTQGTLVRWETGDKYPPVPVFKALCNLYGCKMDDISIPSTLA
jgi:DNA-binding XRE family transcriptional regulator